jgi:hypothetical protein
MPMNRFDASPGDAPESAADAGTDAGTDDDSPRGGPEAVERLHAQLAELVEYGRLYLSARADAIVASLRRLGLWLLIGAVGLVVAFAMLTAAAVIGLLGIADLLGQVLGERPWAGYVVTGFGLLAICALGLFAVMLVLRRSFRNKTVKKYARRHSEQRARFGHDAAQAARASERS